MPSSLLPHPVVSVVVVEPHSVAPELTTPASYVSSNPPPRTSSSCPSPSFQSLVFFSLFPGLPLPLPQDMLLWLMLTTGRGNDPVCVCVLAVVGRTLMLLLLLHLFFNIMLVILISGEESVTAPVRVRGACDNGSFVINLLMSTMADGAVCCVLPSSPSTHVLLYGPGGAPPRPRLRR